MRSDLKTHLATIIMEEARSTVQEYFTDKSHVETETERLMRVENLKPEINSLLHVAMPGDMTVNEVEALSWAIFDILSRPQWYLQSRVSDHKGERSEVRSETKDGTPDERDGEAGTPTP